MTTGTTTATTTISAARQPYEAYARLEAPAAVLGYALAQWETRDDSKPQAEVRQAANTAMEVIDGMLRDLHAMRSRLVGEICDADDVAAARVDAMLTASRGAAD